MAEEGSISDGTVAGGVDPSRRDVIVFDFDGTIGDTLPSITATARGVLLDWGLPEESMVNLPKLVGPPFPQAYTIAFGLSEEDAAEVTERYRAIYKDLGASAWPAFPGMAELLDALRAAGRRLAVASSKRTPLLVRCLTDEGIADRFEVILGKGQDTVLTKAGTLAEVLRRMGAGGEDALMVGDRHYDVEAADSCGIPCVGVTYGNTAEPGELEAAGACVVVDSVDGLGEALLGRPFVARP